MWLERLEQTTPFIERWLSHQRQDAYWRHGSVAETYGEIEIPVYIIGGWADSYNNAIPRLLAGLSGPRKGLIGPWVHTFPEMGPPEPAIGFLQESVRWWDHWLKGIDTGIMAEPMLRAWIQESLPPEIFYPERPGRWVADPTWPSPYISKRSYFLNSNGAAHWLGDAPAAETSLTLAGRQSHGLEGGEWGAYGLPGEFAGDQRAADGESLTFTAPPLAEAMDILGNPEVTVALAADQPQALIAVRLCDVAPNGISALVTWGLLNLTHRDSHEQPTPLVPGQRYTVTVRLNMTGYRLPAGHRWRLAISPTYLRHAWPSPRPVCLRLFTGAASQLHLPTRTPQASDTALPPFGPPEVASPLAVETLRSESRQQVIQRDVMTQAVEFKVVSDDGRVRYPTGMAVDSASVETLSIHEDDPLSAVHRVQRALEYKRDDWQVRLKTDSRLTADATHFYLFNQLDAYEGATIVFSRSWTSKIARDQM
jgi:predicted acyl esterase